MTRNVTLTTRVSTAPPGGAKAVILRAEPCNLAVWIGFIPEKEEYLHNSWIHMNSRDCRRHRYRSQFLRGANVPVRLSPRKAVGAAISCGILGICGRLS